jgi:initiation factor 1A
MKSEKYNYIKMVKNTTGGGKSKGFARKSFTPTNHKLRLPECDEEKFAHITKMFGNGMCEITLNDNTTLVGHIRGKFSGSRKRHNLITVQSIVLVGLRDWENPVKNCDILVIYDDNQVEQLNSMPNVKIDKLMQLRIGGVSKQTITESNITFDYTEGIMGDHVEQTSEAFIMEESDAVNVDEI